uniref:Xylanase inhibitor C-terminal domain-containing protein n=1 Tax=Nelumbo nucifera TaxID=4432 RepID=A0A822ZH11_NELNU|nr:TPA_asm: hypothetical protein HUJ06_000546 [Nelumbo nucifera]DAD44140.1 TPA_asm: hypothetical protein HUJ06_002370 [Nelumbo nucifera]
MCIRKIKSDSFDFDSALCLNSFCLKTFKPGYNIYLQRIVVNQILPIDPTVFALSGNRGTIIDSGTTFAYLAADAYDPFVNVRIAVNGQILPIDPTVFATSSNRGTITDSGTTLAYLAADAYMIHLN